MDYAMGAGGALLGVVILFFLSILIVGGSLGRLGQAIGVYFKVLKDAEFATKVDKIANPEPPKPIKPSGAPIRMLAMLQRDGKLIDFLLDNIQNASNDDIGNFVREMQPKAQATLKKYLTIEPVMGQPEGETVDVMKGFDPSAVQLTGNVSGQPPFKGTLRHPGWRVREIKLAPPPEGQDEFILAPAEVELP